MDEQLKQALEELKTSVMGKTAEERKNAFLEFATKQEELVKVAVENGVKNAEDNLLAEMKKIQDHADKLDVKLQAIKVVGNTSKKGDELKAVITANFEEIKSVRKSHGVEIKADMTLTNNLIGDQNREYDNMVAMVPGQPVNFEQLVRTIPIGVGTFTYPREISVVGAVGVQTEGSEKANLAYNLEMVDANTDFLAGFARYSKKMANNLPYLENFLPQALRRDYYKAENALFYTELSTVAAASTLTAGNIVERIVNEMTTLMSLNYVPNMIVVNPADYGKILLTAGTDGTGSYSLPGVVTVSNGFVSINGLQVVVASWVEADKYIIGDWTYCQKISTQGLGLGFFEQDADNVTKNMITARIESQVTIAVQRPDAFIYGDFTTVI